MSNIKKQFTGILDSLNREKRDINQLYLTSVHTITELRKTDVYVVQIEAILARINKLLKVHADFKKSKNFSPESKEYAKLTNQLAVEYRYLTATNEAMSDNLNEIDRTEGIQSTISGRMIDMKKDIDKVVKKIDKVLNLQNVWH